MGSHSIPQAPTPARRPERIVDTGPEDIQLGDAPTEPSPIKKQGKRSLTRPSGATKAGLNI